MPRRPTDDKPPRRPKSGPRKPAGGRGAPARGASERADRRPTDRVPARAAAEPRSRPQDGRDRSRDDRRDDRRSDDRRGDSRPGKPHGKPYGKPGGKFAGKPPRPAVKEERRPALRPGSSRKVVEAAMTLLDAIAESGEPADRIRHAWMREHHRRFEPAERTALMQISEDVLRMQGRLDWWLAGSADHPSGLDPDNRLRVAALRILSGGAKAKSLLGFFDADEKVAIDLLQRLEGHTLQHPHMPTAAQYSVPEWILPYLEARFGADLEMELAAMLRPAPLDVRINPLKTTRDAAAAALAAEDLRSQPTPFSPLGLRLSPLAYVNNTKAYGQGLVEPQDEGSQLAAQLVEAAGCKFVVDFCAGAGGKTLVLAAAMKNGGRLVAMDVSTGRLTQAKLRLRRASAHNAECREIDAKWLKRHAGQADRVLVDAPCTGTGTWRRKPDAKWRLTPQDLAELVPRQAEILERAAKLVKTGGRLVYVTCSVLREENEDQVAAFLQRHPEFSVLSVSDVWPRTVGGACPVPGPYLSLSPGRHGTDGFFAAILVRNA